MRSLGGLNMRYSVIVLPLLGLAGCGGGGPETAGGLPVGGPGATHSFAAPAEKKTYSAIGAVQRYVYSTDSRDTRGQYDQTYAGNVATARNSNITISYDPRDAIFELTIDDPAAGASKAIRFQDPAHRTNFGGMVEPQEGTPQLEATFNGIHYLQVAHEQRGEFVFDPNRSKTFPVGNANARRDVSTFFYQKPGTTTKYVTFAGYVRNAASIVAVNASDNSNYLRHNMELERAAFVFGERTSNANVPKTGTASYSGAMIATMVFNPLIDQGQRDSYLQWISGTSSTSVDFAAGTFETKLNGKVHAPLLDLDTSHQHTLREGATFTATGSGHIDLPGKGGFVGTVSDARFRNGADTHDVAIAGSSIDGAFHGPAAQEVGGGFRIVGGTPDQRVDILGAFTGADKNR